MCSSGLARFLSSISSTTERGKTDIQVVKSLETIDGRKCFRNNQKRKSGDRKCFARVIIQELEFRFECTAEHTRRHILFLPKEAQCKPMGFQVHGQGNVNSHSRD